MESFFTKPAPSYTFEIFPPKGNKSTEATYGVIDSLVSFNPDLISVTYGAGGSSRDNTVEIASGIQNKYNVCGVAHLTCVGTTRENIRGILNELKANNVRNILALRGDLPAGAELGDFHHASELIKFIKDEYGDDFDVFAACYPEKHPEANSVEEDLIHLKEKCELGLKGLISQLFFDNDIFWNWKDGYNSTDNSRYHANNFSRSNLKGSRNVRSLRPRSSQTLCQCLWPSSGSSQGSWNSLRYRTDRRLVSTRR